MIRILLVDDHSYFNMGVTTLFENHEDIRIIDSCTSGIDALEKLKSIKIDVVLLDIAMPEMEGIECCKQIKKLYPDIKVIAFTGETNTQVYYDIWLQKVDGILLKTCESDELISCIKNVIVGQKIIGINVPSFFEKASKKRTTTNLTRKEKEILKLLGTGISRKEAADRLFISIDTVNFHCKNIFRKFNNTKLNSIIAEAKKAKMLK